MTCAQMMEVKNGTQLCRADFFFKIKGSVLLRGTILSPPQTGIFLCISSKHICRGQYGVFNKIPDLLNQHVHISKPNMNVCVGTVLGGIYMVYLARYYVCMFSTHRGRTMI